MKRNLDQVRHYAGKHHEAHNRLKNLLQSELQEEKIWPVFVGTFFIVLISFILYSNWGRIASFFTPNNTAPAVIETRGTQKGVLGAYKVENQASNQYSQFLSQIPSEGYLKGMHAASGFARVEKAPTDPTSIREAIEITSELSTGQHLTQLEQSKTRILQKSILATYYLGEKTIDLNSTLQTDAQILGQMKNALEVDLFQYLNQAEHRADALQEYLNLLEILNEKATHRSQDLNSKIQFLTANFQATEQRLQLSESAFFNNLQTLDGPNAEQELGKFIGFQEAQVEVRAKIGAYQGLKDYYDFFKPRLENLIEAIKANRDALVAGVRVIEIQNMSLPLIIRER